ncbi:DUF4446 family protein [Anaerolentibacter hominis]|uniref:DUF4446 family protein n=1 Tax=Anaerolentibacter hominis TaxID=3079009 RepID=UPI0031B85978
MGKIYARVINVKLLDQLGLDVGYILLGLVAVAVILAILVLVLIIRQNKLNKRYKKFMGKDGDGSLERRILDRFSRISDIEESLDKMQERMKSLEKSQRGTYQKFAIVKYDAFHEAKGNISFVLCMLDHNNNGFLLNSMYANDGCYAYIKELKFGICEFPLSEEEEQAFQEAVAMEEKRDKEEEKREEEV